MVIQVNKGSLLGRFGRYSYDAAHYMMRKKLVNVVASDCHRPHHRTPVMIEAYDRLLEKYSREYLDVIFTENPKRICKSEEVIL